MDTTVVPETIKAVLDLFFNWVIIGTSILAILFVIVSLIKPE
jgi:hypothetical protein